MLIHPEFRPKPRTWNGAATLSKNTICEVKLDGYRTTIERYAEKIVAYGRKAYVHVDLPDRILKRVRMLPPDSVLDGELYVAGCPASEVITHIKDGDDALEFVPFAVPVYAGENLKFASFDRRDAILREIGLAPPSRWKIDLTRLTIEELKEAARSWGVEGWILKEWHYYRWWKVKPTRTVDCVVTGTKPGVGKHAGRIGSLECRLFDKRPGAEDYMPIVANVGKGNDAAWRDLSPDSVIGRVCEVEYEEVQSRGKLKFSSFVRWRDDEKAASECTLDQLEERGDRA